MAKKNIHKTTSQQRTNKKPDLSLTQVIGVMLAFIIVYAIIILQFEIYSHHDIKAFHTWSQALTYDAKRIYEIVYNQYPLLGYYLSTIIFKGTKNWTDVIIEYRLWLILAEFIIAIGYYLILREFTTRKVSLLYTLFIASLPVIYASSSLLGQIDGFIHLFIVFSALFLIKMYKEGQKKRPRLTKIHLMNFLFSIFLIFAIHTKQLSFFPGITLAIFYIAILFLLFNNIKITHLALYPAISILLLLIITRIFDRMVNLPEGTYTIYQFLLSFRSNHLSSVVNGAPNIWLFFLEGPPNQANDTLYIGSISFLHGGYLLVLTSFITMLFFLIKTISYILKNKAENTPELIQKKIIKLSSLLCISIAFITLCSYIFMTGMFDRFAIYCFPFYLLGLGILWQTFPRKTLLIHMSIGSIGALIYGIYLITTYSGIPTPIDTQKIIVSIYLLLTIHLIYLLNRISNV